MVADRVRGDQRGPRLPDLGLAVGVFAGLVLRRSLPALAAGFVGSFVVMAVLQMNRGQLWPAADITSKAGEPDWQGWLVERGVIDDSGARVVDPTCVQGCGNLKAPGGYYATYHPSSHFWPLQLVETGIVLALVAALVLGSFWLLRRIAPGTGSRTGGAV